MHISPAPGIGTVPEFDGHRFGKPLHHAFAQLFALVINLALLIVAESQIHAFKIIRTKQILGRLLRAHLLLQRLLKSLDGVVDILRFGTE